jgi:CheY-like chemotaxis protein
LARKILLADDSVTAQNMGRKILADAGYEVVTVNNGSAALKKIAEQKPDLIVLDVYMPGYSGLEVCQRLKEANETSRVPVLLTVGKLEPFKPEEAKRVRADAFIVKPFEASELLSALSKLEDKIVPRAETAKPGRFARVTAALDEGRYDKTVAIDEDSGWKNRIQFPKKKENSAQNDGDDADIYNAMNKDLRTVVERKSTTELRAAKAEATRVDVSALAPEGLPKDVTAEEIAALAAAAAQVKGKIEESKAVENQPSERARAEVKADGKTEPNVEPNLEPKPETRETSPAAPAQVVAAASPTEPESRQNIEIDARPGLDEEKLEKKIEEWAQSSPATQNQTAEAIAPSRADVMAAIAGLEVDSVSSDSPNSANGSRTNGADRRIADRRAQDVPVNDEPVADEPVTMAAAAGAESAAFASRWTAVSVAVAPEEAALSLELEMQKAYAAFAAAETAHGGSAKALAETQPPVSEPTAAATPTPALTVPATPAPEAAHTLSAMASAATAAIGAAVKELEAVAESYLAPKTPAPAEPESVPLENAEVAAPAASKVAIAAQPEVASALPQPEAKLEEIPAASTEQLTALISPSEAPSGAPDITSEAKIDAPAPPDPSMAGTAEMAAPTLDTNVPAEPDSKELTSAHEAPATRAWENPATSAPAPAASDLTKDSDIVATTAAAWASWRQIRESGASESGTSESGAPDSGIIESGSSTPAASQSASFESSPKAAEETLHTQDTAAMAVAAGAENHRAESASEPDSEGIANIVDSVLADLRPKIFEEISRKMGKKK